MRFRIVVDGDPHELAVVRTSTGVRVSVDGAEYRVRTRRVGDESVVSIGPARFRIRLERGRVLVDGRAHDVVTEPLDAGFEEPEDTALGGPRGRVEVRPPMPGRVVAVRTAAGQRVRRGQTLVVLEAMKMQNEIPAPADGIVEAVHVQEGESIPGDRVLIVLAVGPVTAP